MVLIFGIHISTRKRQSGPDAQDDSAPDAGSSEGAPMPTAMLGTDIRSSG